jgi:quinol monooxygenase YgiN
MISKETPIGWTVQFKINPGKVDAFRKIVKELVVAVEEADPGTLMYQWFLSQDEQTCHVHVWCASQEAIIAHATGIGPQKYLPQLLELATLERFDVFGKPNEQFAKILEAFPVTSRNPHFAGFTR